MMEERVSGIGYRVLAAFIVLLLIVSGCAAWQSEVPPTAESGGAPQGYDFQPFPPASDRLTAPDGFPDPALWITNDGATNLAADLVLENGVVISNTVNGQVTISSTDGISLTVVGGGLRVAADATSPSLTGGYGGNVASGIGAVVGGGGVSGNVNTASGDYAVVGGGRNNVAESRDNTVAGGYNNQIIGSSWEGAAISGGEGNAVSNDYSNIGGGRSNSIESGYSVISGGWNNEIADWNSAYNTIAGGIYNVITDTSTFAFIGGGRNNTVTDQANFAAVGGYYATAADYGQQAHASGRFAANGDAQHGTWVARRSIVMSATWTPLYLDGSSQEISIAADQVMTMRILLVGTMSGAAQSWGYEIVAVVENDGSTTTILAQTVTTLYEDTATYDVRLLASVGNTIRIQVHDSGASGDTVRWVAVIDAAEVTYP